MAPELRPFVATAGGLVVRGRRGGEGPTALLLHGTAGSWRNFRPWLPSLLPRAHLFIPDLPGFGESPAPALRPRLRTWARLLHALAAELDTPPRIVVGLGLGASVAMAYLETAAAAAPPLTHLVLHTPAYYPAAVKPGFRWAVHVLGSPPVFAVVGGLLGRPDIRDWYLQHFVQGEGMPADDARLLREDFSRTSLPVLRGLARDLVRADFRPRLQACPTPTLVLVAEEDPFVYPAEVARLGELMPCATVVVQRNIGHGWTEAAIAEQNATLARFLDQEASASMAGA
jgi:pimeloyl-ACP methyl ester carboxylesterase